MLYTIHISGNIVIFFQGRNDFDKYFGDWLLRFYRYWYISSIYTANKLIKFPALDYFSYYSNYQDNM